MLKVDKLRDTRALQINVTLPDPHTAQAMAQFIAEGAVELSRSGGKEADEARIEDASKAADTAQGSPHSTLENAWQKAAGAHSAEALRSEVSDESYLKSRVGEQLLDEETRRRCARSRARAELLKKRIDELSLAIRRKSAALAQQSAREDNLQAMLTAARASYDASTQRLADLRVSAGSRSEWLRLVDPGIVPAAAQFAERAVDPDWSGVAGAVRIFVVPHDIVQPDARTAGATIRRCAIATHGDD